MKQKTRSLLTLLLTIVLGAVLALGVGFMVGCGGESDSDVTITLSKTEAEIVCGESTRIVATVSDGSSVTWSSSNESVATVSTSGQVTGKTAGTSVITAAVGSVTATCTVTVVDVTVTISETSVSIDKGETYQLSATASKSDSVIAWSSSDETIATVDSTGLVTTKKAGTVTITATYGTTSYSASCTVTVVWDAPDGYTEIVNAGETDTFTTYPDQWVYWNDQGWCGSNVTAIEAYTESSGAATFIYEGASTACYYGYQIFYTNTSLTGGAYYKVTIVINSAVAGSITISGNVVDLAVGDNTVVIYKTEAAEKGTYGDASIGFQMGVSDGSDSGTVIESNTFVIKSVTWEEYTAEALATPTDLAITSAGVVTFTDSTNSAANVDSYVLTFYSGETAKYTCEIVSGGTIDSSAYINGEYTVTIKAVGSGAYGTSAESTGVSYTITDGLEVLQAPTAVSIASDGTVTITDGNTTTDHVTGYIVYLKANGVTYLTATIANGDKISTYYLTNKDYTVSVVAVGDSEYADSDEYVSDTTYNPNNSSIEYEFTTTGTETQAIATPGIWLAWADSDNGGTGSLTSLSYDDGTITLVASTNASVWYSIQLFYKNPELTSGKKYVLTLNLNSTSAGTVTINGTVVTLKAGDNEIEITYTESSSGSSFSMQVGSSDGTVDISSVNFTLTDVKWELAATKVSELDATAEYTATHNNEAAALETTDTVYAWYLGDYNYTGDWSAVENTDVIVTYNNGTITYTVNKNDYGASYWYANQLFYKNSELTAGTTYRLTMTINATVAGSITINGTVVELVVGSNAVSVDYVEGSDENGCCSIDIQLGVNGSEPSITGTLTISDVVWSTLG